MNAQVVTVSSRYPEEAYYRFDVFLESLRRFGEVPVVLGMDQPWRGVMTKPFLLREWLRAGCNTSDRLIVCDAWDVVFTKHPHGIGDDCAKWYGDAVVFNGEKGMWPRADLAEFFPDGGSPWRFLNSGFFCGPAVSILALLEAMEIETIGFDPPGGPYPNDQGEFQALFAGEKPTRKTLVYSGLPDGQQDFAHIRRVHDGRAKLRQPVKMAIDSVCCLAQTLSACNMDEFDFSGPHIVNKVTWSEPGVWHLNGPAKELFGPAIYAKYNLP